MARVGEYNCQFQFGLGQEGSAGGELRSASRIREKKDKRISLVFVMCFLRKILPRFPGKTVFIASCRPRFGYVMQRFKRASSKKGHFLGCEKLSFSVYVVQHKLLPN